MFFQISNHRLQMNWLGYFFKLVLVFVISFCFIPVSHAENRGEACPLNKPLKVAVMAVGLQKNTTTYFTQILKNLGEDGIVSKNSIPRTIDLRNNDDYKKNITEAVKGKCLDFPVEYSYIFNWEIPAFKEKIEEIRSLIKDKKIDFILSMGDLTSKYLIEEKLNIPIICFDTNSTLTLKEIVRKNRLVSILDDSRNIKDDIDLFYRMFSYSNLGFFRDKNHEFDLYTSYDDVMNYTKEKNIPIKVCEGDFFIPDVEKSRSEFSRCVTELADSNISAVFIPEVGNGIDIKQLYTQIRPLLSKKVATISYDSKEQVAAGSLLSVYDPDEFTRASYAADLIGELIFNAFDSSIVMNRKELSVPLFFGVNLKTASLVQWRPEFDVLVAVDDVFHTTNSK